jgi:hypothetical protein
MLYRSSIRAIAATIPRHVLSSGAAPTAASASRSVSSSPALNQREDDDGRPSRPPLNDSLDLDAIFKDMDLGNTSTSSGTTSGGSDTTGGSTSGTESRAQGVKSEAISRDMVDEAESSGSVLQRFNAGKLE